MGGVGRSSSMLITAAVLCGVATGGAGTAAAVSTSSSTAMVPLSAADLLLGTFARAFMNRSFSDPPAPLPLLPLLLLAADSVAGPTAVAFAVVVSGKSALMASQVVLPPPPQTEGRAEAAAELPSRLVIGLLLSFAGAAVSRAAIGSRGAEACRRRPLPPLAPMVLPLGCTAPWSS